MKTPVVGVFLPADLSIPPTERTFTCLEDMQKAVGGFIEAVTVAIGDREVTLWINEEGKLQDLPHNARATRLFRRHRLTDDSIVGDAFLLGPPTDEGEETPFTLAEYPPPPTDQDRAVEVLDQFKLAAQSTILSGEPHQPLFTSLTLDRDGYFLDGGAMIYIPQLDLTDKGMVALAAHQLAQFLQRPDNWGYFYVTPRGRGIYMEVRTKKGLHVARFYPHPALGKGLGPEESADEITLPGELGNLYLHLHTDCERVQ